MMQIDAYNNLLSSISADLKTPAQIEKNDSSRPADPVIELEKGFGTILEKALAEPDGRDAVARARQALADGSLENQKALESTADCLLNFGI